MMYRSSDVDVATIASYLKLQQEIRGRTILFLGTRAGLLFQDAHLYDMLEKFSGSDLSALDPLERFAECYRLLRAFSSEDIHSLVRAILQAQGKQPRYADVCLAELLRLGIFDLVITTNIDRGLEEALNQVGLHEAHDFELFIPEDGAHEVPQFDRRLSFTLLKAFGDFSRKNYVFKERWRYLESRPGLQSILDSTRNWNVLLIGVDPVWDDALLRALFPRRGTCWYVNEALPSELSHLYDFLQENPVRYLLGEQGCYEQFVPALFAIFSDAAQPSGNERSNDNATSQPSTAEMPRSEPASQAVRYVRSHAPLQHADVLLVTATEIEIKAVFEQTGLHQVPYMYIKDRTYYDLGTIGGARVAMMQSAIGAGGAGGARFTVNEGIQALTPFAVMMVGIACGFKRGEQKIGDILVSEILMAYDYQRISTDPVTGEQRVSPRGPRVFAPVRMLDRFRNGMLTLDLNAWEAKPCVHFGLVLSGDKLIDHWPFVESLRALEPEALGAEMEGAGLYDAASRHKVDWLLVKAISDWGDGHKQRNKRRQQALAARNAARFTLEVIAQGGLANHDFK